MPPGPGRDDGRHNQRMHRQMSESFDPLTLIGLSVEAHDRVTGNDLDDFAATIGEPVRPWPPGFHWAMFGRFQRALRHDGHPLTMAPFPPLPFPRRMWAGGEVAWLAPVATGSDVRRLTTVERASVKQGRIGPFMLASLRHRLTEDGTPVVDERQDIAFLQPDAAPGSTAGEAPGFAPDWQAQVTPDPVTLFRYSALTGNGHRIHYDHPYATEVEGYGGVVVHGPLIATWLMQAAERWGGVPLKRFAYRGVRPTFAGRPITLIGRRDGAGLQLAAVSADGFVLMRATANG